MTTPAVDGARPQILASARRKRSLLGSGIPRATSRSDRDDHPLVARQRWASLSVTLRMTCVVSAFSTSGATMVMRAMFSAPAYRSDPPS